MRGSRGRGQGAGSRLENHKNKGFLSNTLNNHKAAKPAFNVGPSLACQRNAIEMAIEMAFRWRADDGLLLVVFGSPIN